MCAVSNFMALIPTLPVCHSLVIFFRSWFLKDYILPHKRTRKSSSCVPVLHKTWNQKVSRRRRAAEAELLFCQSNPVAFCRPLCRRRCLRSLSQSLLAVPLLIARTLPSAHVCLQSFRTGRRVEIFSETRLTISQLLNFWLYWIKKTIQLSSNLGLNLTEKE